jgi:nitroimidazol reductase NimA-like FMN-containing flavoprotein (pyridoxamine 5'-phosphate oxidase superfamily)
MSNTYPPIRRADRAMNDAAWIRDFLHHAPVGVVAVAHAGQPYLNTVMFAYDEPSHTIGFHSAPSGRLVEMLAHHPHVCFTAYQMGRLLPAPTAMGFGVEYASVVMFGTAMLIEDEAIARASLQRLLTKYGAHLQAGKDYRAVTSAEVQATAVYHIAIEHWSGKQKLAPADAPGAFWYPDQQQGRE